MGLKQLRNRLQSPLEGGIHELLATRSLEVARHSHGELG